MLTAAQALVAAEHQSKRYRRFLDSILGLVLLGVPHVRDTTEDTVQRVANLLRPILKTVSKKSLRKEDLHRLGLLSDKFREVSLPLPEGLISGYETEQRALASHPWKVGKSFAILVDKRFATIEWPGNKEQLLPLNVQVEAIFNPHSRCEFRSQLKLYISKVAGAASMFVNEARELREANQIQLRQQGFHQPARSSPENIPSIPNRPVSGAGQTNLPLLPGRPTHSPLQATPPPRGSPENNKTPSLGTMSSAFSSSGGSDSSFEMVTEAATFNSEQRRLNLPCYLLKPHSRNKRFWPREDILQRVEHALLPRSAFLATEEGTVNIKNGDEDVPSLRTYVLYGMGGVGKTELATEFAFKHKDKFDAVFILHADVSSTLSSEFVKIADKLGLNYDGDAENAKETVKEWLANPVKNVQAHGGKDLQISGGGFASWLIVFDNADRPEILRKFYPEDGRGSILVTSRDPEANDENYFGEAGEEVVTLSRDDGAAFLRSLTKSGDSSDVKESSEAITERLDGLPLAIEQISAFIRKHRLRLPQFVDAYEDDKDFEALQDDFIAPRRGYEHSIAGVWALQRLSIGSLALLNIMSFLDPDCMHQKLFRRTLSSVHIGPYPGSRTEYIKALTGLLERSLVSQSPDGDELRVHRLVQSVARAQMRQAETLDTHFDAVVDMIWNDFPRITRGGVGRAHKVDRWERCAELFPHIQRLREMFLSLNDESKRIKRLARFTDLLNEAGWQVYMHN